MKLSPLFIFLILLCVLVISVIFSNWLPLNNSEGFISQYNNKKSLDIVNIPQYSKQTNVSKLYDNLFFDTANGNLIEVNGSIQAPPISGNVIVGNVKSCNTNTCGVNNIWVVSTDSSRQNNNIVVNYPNNVVDHTTESKNPYTNSYNYWSYTTQTPNKITDTYQVFYINWLDIRFLHIIDLTKLTNVKSYIFDDGNLYVSPLTTNVPSISPPPSTTPPVNNNAGIQSNIIEPLYDPTTLLYQLTPFVNYDGKNRKILIKNKDGSVSLYNAGVIKNPVKLSTPAVHNSNSTGGISNVSLSSAMIYDNNNNIVLSTIYNKLTIIVLIQYYNNKYTINNVFRFDWQGKLSLNGNVITPTPSAKPPLPPSPVKPPVSNGNNDAIPTNNDGIDISGNHQSDYYKWYWYWKIADNHNNNKESISNDYILKTQVVPPVCPSCPSCPSSSDGVCSNCGGNGGSGTLNNDINSLGYNINKDLNNLGSVIHQDAKSLVSGLNTNVNNLGSVLHQDAKSLISGLNQDVHGIGSTLHQDAKSLISGVNQNVNAIGSGLYNAGSGLGSGLNQNLNNFGQYNGGVGGGGGGSQYNGGRVGQYNAVNTGIDNYSAYGALSSKGGNFIPITNSFSAFGK